MSEGAHHGQRGHLFALSLESNPMHSFEDSPRLTLRSKSMCYASDSAGNAPSSSGDASVDEPPSGCAHLFRCKYTDIYAARMDIGPSECWDLSNPDKFVCPGPRGLEHISSGYCRLLLCAFSPKEIMRVVRNGRVFWNQSRETRRGVTIT